MRCLSGLFGLAVCASILIPIGAAIARSDSGSFLTVPFLLEGNRVIISTSVNGSQPLKLLLDTGMRFDGVYLFRREALSLIDTTGAIEVQVGGAGSGEPTRATMIETARLAFGDVSVEKQRVVISHSEQTQHFSSDGVIGWSLFGHYIVEIDYDRKLITLHDTAEVIERPDWVTVPILVKENIPFLDVTVTMPGGEPIQMHVYIDLASREALELLIREGQKFTTPEGLKDTLLGSGLSGDIYGSYGKVASVALADHTLRDVRTAFAPAAVRSKQDGADGILGNDLMRRFNMVFDYSHDRLYIKPNGSTALPFE